MIFENKGCLPVISQPSLSFRNLNSGAHLESIWLEIVKMEIWRDAQFEQHEGNTRMGFRDRSPWRPVIPALLPLYPGMSWCADSNAVLDPTYRPKDGEGSLVDFLEASRRFFRRFEGRLLGVQLSGGLDSSLVIGLLRHFEIPHALVGLKTDRYEFRTELHVQEKLATAAEAFELIDGEACLPCSDLVGVPPHQVPDLLSLNYSQDLAMAEACGKLGIEVLFSGGGGDNLLVEAVPEDPAQCMWRPQIFTDPFPVDVVYRPHGIEFCSFFEDRGVVDAVYRLRRGQGEDLRKYWARTFFSDFLPLELVEYGYCADFWGRDIDGLLATLPAIREVHGRAASLTGSDYFAEEHLEELLAQDLLRPEKSFYHRLEARISSAVWVCSLQKAFAADQHSRDDVASGSEPEVAHA